jgi:hypothetical protein
MQGLKSLINNRKVQTNSKDSTQESRVRSLVNERSPDTKHSVIPGESVVNEILITSSPKTTAKRKLENMELSLFSPSQPLVDNVRKVQCESRYDCTLQPLVFQRLLRGLDEGNIPIGVDWRFLSEHSNKFKPPMAFFRKVLTCWGNVGVLQDKSDSSRMEAATFIQTQQHLVPLLEKAHQDSLGDDIIRCLTRISLAACARRYVEANSGYMELSIGNKPWNIGVGNVFIQERSSMDKLASVPHMLNDEATRRYVQAVKRLLTKAETFWPAVDPTQIFNRT